jgi:hypothetical protein
MLAPRGVAAVAHQLHGGPRRLRDERGLPIEGLEEVALAKQPLAEHHVVSLCACEGA